MENRCNSISFGCVLNKGFPALCGKFDREEDDKLINHEI